VVLLLLVLTYGVVGHWDEFVAGIKEGLVDCFAWMTMTVIGYRRATRQ
jgi:hypothetical protein